MQSSHPFMQNLVVPQLSTYKDYAHQCEDTFTIPKSYTSHRYTRFEKNAKLSAHALTPTYTHHEKKRKKNEITASNPLSNFVFIETKCKTVTERLNFGFKVYTVIQY